MAEREVEPVYLPHNEPYLGCKSLIAFDMSIPRAMHVHAAISSKTFSRELSPLQRCATEIIPQGVSIALSIRELIRQAYLFSAAILLRPLVDRVGLTEYLVTYPSAVAAWHDGWPRKTQPKFDALLALVIPDVRGEYRDQITSLMNKIVHTDPTSALFNMFKRNDGTFAFSSGKILSNAEAAEVIAYLANHCLRRLTALSALVFDYLPEGAAPQSSGGETRH